MPRLKLDDLQVTSFATTAEPSATITVIDTQQIECWSPFCMETQQRTCTC
ncbi:MAG TPA: pinensin family lanthipeptide [Longimicrobiaceae bacterium]